MLFIIPLHFLYLTAMKIVGAGGGLSPLKFLDMRKKIVFSAPTILKLHEKGAAKFISTPSILQLTTGIFYLNHNMGI